LRREDESLALKPLDDEVTSDWPALLAVFNLIDFSIPQRMSAAQLRARGALRRGKSLRFFLQPEQQS
jgi:hypothetical protein